MGGVEALAELVLHTLNHVDYIVAKLFSLTDDIHIEDTRLVVVLLLIHVLNILHTQQVAVVVDFALLVEVTQQVAVMYILNVAENHKHIGKCLAHILHHGVDVGVKLLSEMAVTLLFANECAREVVAAVADALNLGDNAAPCRLARQPDGR